LQVNEGEGGGHFLTHPVELFKESEEEGGGSRSLFVFIYLFIYEIYTG